MVNSGNREKIIKELTSYGVDFVDMGDMIQLLHFNRGELARILVSFPERLRQRPATLEDVFFRLTGRTLVE